MYHSRPFLRALPNAAGVRKVQDNPTSCDTFPHRRAHAYRAVGASADRAATVKSFQPIRSVAHIVALAIPLRGRSPRALVGMRPRIYQRPLLPTPYFATRA